MLKKKSKKIKLTLIITGCIFLLSLIIIIKWAISLPVPDLQTFEQRKVIQSTKIYDRTGKNLLYDVHENIKRTTISNKDMNRHIRNATVAIEDTEFYNHGGVKITSIFRAILTNLESGKIRKGQGGSTITQQLVKNTFLTREKTFTRKIKELILSLKIEKVFSKDEILTLYLNEIPYGGNNYGVETASESYFKKKARDLTLAESAYLAALPQAPSYYSPFGAHKDELDARKNLVLKRMLAANFITEEEFKEAEKEKVDFISSSDRGIQAPHFVMYIKSYLEEKYGKDVVEQDGLKITTTLDLNLQKEAEKLVNQYALENDKKFNAKNAGLVALDPKNGQILVMVGSRDYFDIKVDGNFNTTLAKRQPGSSFKPFVYATALKKGYTLDTIVFDLKTEFNTGCNPDGSPQTGINPDKCYHPVNYDNKFRGPITLRNALAQSINIPAVKALYLAGIKDSLETAQDLGINTLTDPSRYGLTLVLGGGEVTPLEMTGAYSVFANDGIRNPITSILKIEDKNGDILEEFTPNSQKVLDNEVARNINSVLSDNNARAPAFGERSPLYFQERDVAAKTGTTNDYKDAWVIGYTPNFALGLWVGNNDNSPMEKKVAGFIAAPLWNDFFKKVLDKLPKEDFLKPINEHRNETKPVLEGNWQGGKIYFIDKISKKLATKDTPPELLEKKVLIQIHSILYWVDKNNPQGDQPLNPYDDPQFTLWETPIRQWLKYQNIKEETEVDLPREFDDIHKPEYFPEIKIINPKDGDVFKKDNPITIKIEPSSRFPLEQMDFYFENDYLGSLKTPVYEFVFKPNVNSIKNNSGQIRIIVYDNIRNKKEYNITVNFSD